MIKDTKEHIVRISMKLFARKGFKEVTMKEIVDETGLSKGAFYHYFESKEKIFEEVVKHFYNNMIITDYSDFPQTSLKEFCHFYLKRLENTPDETDNADENMNTLVFISDAVRKVPSFLDIHNAQRKKEIAAWTNIIAIAKETGEIQSGISNKDIAAIFLNLSDGVALNRMFARDDEASQDIKRDWDNLYRLLQRHEKYGRKSIRH